MTSPERKRRWFQFGLGWAAYWMLVAGIAMGWARAHQEANQKLIQLPLEIDVMNRQISDLNLEIKGDLYYYDRSKALRVTAENVVSWWNPIPRVPLESPEQFLKVLKAHQEIDRQPGRYGEVYSNGWTQQLLVTSDPVFHETIAPLIPLLEVPETGIRRELVRMFHGLVAHDRKRIELHFDVIVPALINRLNDPGERVRIEAVQALETIGLEAHLAREPLEEIAADDDDPVAIFAALALESIDPEYDAIPRLKQLVEQRKSDWECATQLLADILPPDEAEAFLTSQVSQTAITPDIELFARELNRLMRRQSFATVKEVAP